MPVSSGVQMVRRRQGSYDSEHGGRAREAIVASWKPKRFRRTTSATPDRGWGLRQSNRFDDLREDDVHRKPDTLACGVPSIDKTSFADLWYSTRTQNALVYVYEIANEIVAFVHFKYQNSGRLFLDLIACDNKVQDQKVGGPLMRWVETFARSSKCTAIDLWSISGRVEWYKKHGFNLSGEDKMDLGGGEIYEKMSRRILYNVKPIELPILA